MALFTQIINVHYKGNYLSLLASDNRTPLYTVKTSSQPPQMAMFRHGDDSNLTGSASFQHFSTEVSLTIRGRVVPLQRDKFLSRTSHFTSSSEEVLWWKPDGALTGNFKLVDKKEQIWARFRNKVLSTAEVGSFEIIRERGEEFVDETVMSGLGMLVMVQSCGLAMMVIFGGNSSSLIPLRF